MHTRDRITASTLRKMSHELAGTPVDEGLAASHVADIEALMAGVDELRKLPLKDVMPPLAFAPEEDLR